MANTYIIYMIKCNDGNVGNCYIGSTMNFRTRKHHHKSHCSNENSKKYNLKLYKFIRLNGFWDNFEMKPIEEYLCDSKMQAVIREQHWIDYYQPDLNSVNAHTTEEGKNDKMKEYEANNKDKIKETKRVYRENNKDKIKLYKENNKEVLRQKAKERYENNRDTTSEIIFITTECECGGKYSSRGGSKPRHIKSQIHQNYILNNDAVQVEE
jgi:hypothetical protein